MRMIDQLSKVLARVLFLNTAREFPKSALELATATRNLLGLDRDLILVMSDDQLLELLKADDSLSGPKCYVLGMLLNEEATLAGLREDHESATSLRLKSLSLLLKAYTRSEGPVVPSHPARIDELAGGLQHTEIPLRIRTRLFAYYESVGKYDRAENVLFDLIDQDPEQIRTGLDFYARLKAKDDAELARGNLPRDEIEEGIRDLTERSARTG